MKKLFPVLLLLVLMVGLIQAKQLAFTSAVENLADGDTFQADIHWKSMIDSIQAVVNGSLANDNFADTMKLQQHKVDSTATLATDWIYNYTRKIIKWVLGTPQFRNGRGIDFYINDTTANTKPLRVYADSTKLLFLVSEDSLYSGILFKLDSASIGKLKGPLNCNSQAMTLVDINSGNIDATIIGVNSDTTGKFTRLTADSLGVGTASPLTNLDVTGKMCINNTGVNSIPALSTALVTGEINGTHNALNSDYGFLRLSAGGGGTLKYKSGIDIQGYGSTDISKLKFYTGGQEKMSIDSSGKAKINKQLFVGNSTPGDHDNTILMVGNPSSVTDSDFVLSSGLNGYGLFVNPTIKNTVNNNANYGALFAVQTNSNGTPHTITDAITAHMGQVQKDANITLDSSTTLSINTPTGGNFNRAIYIKGGTAGANNYSILSTSPAKSSFSGDISCINLTASGDSGIISSDSANIGGIWASRGITVNNNAPIKTNGSQILNGDANFDSVLINNNGKVSNSLRIDSTLNMTTGSLKTDSTNMFLTDNKSFTGSVSRTICTQISDGINSDTVVATMVGNKVGSLALPANALIVGRTIRLRMMGEMTIDAGVNFTANVQLGAVSLLTISFVGPIGGLSSDPFEIVCDMTCRSIGTSGSVRGQGGFTVDDNSATVFCGAASGITGTINTETGMDIDIKGYFDTFEGGTITSKTFACEVLN